MDKRFSKIGYLYPKYFIMKQVSINSIEKAIDKIDNLDDEGLGRISETYALAQQTLLGYIMSASVEYKNEQLEGLLIYYYCLISEAFTQEQVTLNQISEDDIDAFEQPLVIRLRQRRVIFVKLQIAHIDALGSADQDRHIAEVAKVDRWLHPHKIIPHQINTTNRHTSRQHPAMP